MDLPDAENGRLRLYALDFPGSNGVIREGFEPTTESTVAQVFRTGEPILDGAWELASDPVARELGIKSLCQLPLTSRDRVLGVLGVGSVRENPFSQDDVTFLAQFARQVAIAVDNAVAYGQISDLRDRLAQERLYLEDEIRSELNFKEVVGKSGALRRVLTKLARLHVRFRRFPDIRLDLKQVALDLTKLAVGLVPFQLANHALILAAVEFDLTADRFRLSLERLQDGLRLLDPGL